MGKLCNTCGSPVADRAIFCTVCGNRLPVDETPPKTCQDPETPEEAVSDPALNTCEEKAAASEEIPFEEGIGTQKTAFSANFYEDDFTPASAAPLPTQEDSTVSIGRYMLYILLFSIPLFGWITAIIMVCGGTKNKNLKNFAAAHLIWLAIGLLIFALFAVFFVLIYDTLLAFFNVDSLSDLIEAFSHYQN